MLPLVNLGPVEEKSMPLLFARTNDEFCQNTRRLHDTRAGGTVTFVGSVRGSNHNKEVALLDYEAHEPLAEAMFAELEQQAIRQFGMLESHAVHRLGKTLVGDDAVFIQVMAKHRSEAFLAARFLIDELKKTLPIWKKEVYADNTHSFSQTGHCLHDSAINLAILNPVKRALSARNAGDLLAKHVVLIGAGGLGCPLAINLATLGIGKLTILDDDRIAWSNLARQYAYTLHDEGKKKAITLKQFIGERWPFTSVIAHAERVDEACARHYARDAHVIIDATDDAHTKQMLKRLAYREQFALVSASVHQQDGEVQVFNPQKSGGCLLCFAQPAALAEACARIGVLTHVCQMVASVATEKALLLLTNQFSSRTEMSIVDPQFGVQTMHIEQDPRCVSCGARATQKKLVRLVR